MKTELLPGETKDVLGRLIFIVKGNDIQLTCVTSSSYFVMTSRKCNTVIKQHHEEKFLPFYPVEGERRRTKHLLRWTLINNEPFFTFRKGVV
jgi:hypothetical protein